MSHPIKLNVKCGSAVEEVGEADQCNWKNGKAGGQHKNREARERRGSWGSEGEKV